MQLKSQHELTLKSYEAPFPYQVILVPTYDSDTEQMAQNVLTGLRQDCPRIPCTYLYDEIGSRLFEQITGLQAYYPTRTETAILKKIAPELCQSLNCTEIVELGSGSSTKTRILLDAWQAQQQFLTYIPIDINYSVLSEAVQQLAYDYGRICILGLCGEYEAALEILSPDATSLILFLGGTIGNLTPQAQKAFFRQLHQTVKSGTKLLIGFDLKPHAGKPIEIIQNAYNDSTGVTERFNLNLLNHMNQRLQADFVLEHWRHEAIYNEEAHQIEMYLISQFDQAVTIRGLEFHFQTGQRIRTEISRRFDPDELASWFEMEGFRQIRFWSDKKRYFGLMLFESF